MELGDNRVESGGTMVGLAVDGHVAASLDDGQRKQETWHDQGAKLARVVLKVDRDRQWVMLLA